MNATFFLISVAVALVATLIHAAISGAWTARSLAATFCFALALLILPTLIHL